jgi:multiple sugar transport system permease protein
MKNKLLSFPYKVIIPYILFISLLVLFPICTNFYLSFQTKTPSIFTNYKEMFTSPTFVLVGFNTLVWVIGSVTFQLLVGLGTALLLNRCRKGRSLFGVFMFVLPWAVPDVVTALA